MKTETHAGIYLDHNATTPIDPAVAEAMMPFLNTGFGNPSSPYPMGLRAKREVERSRESVAQFLGCTSHEVVFTSGGSESNNWVIKGIVDFGRPEAFHVITSAIEHPTILNPVAYLVELGVQATVLPVDGYGRIDPADVKKAIRPDTALISVMMANNETGTLQPVEEISKIAKEARIPFHTDAAQAVGKIPVDVRALGVDFLTIAGHKLYAPKGVGALYVREGRSLIPLIHGGGQEQGKRSGTESILLCAGLGAACRVAKERLSEDMRTMRSMRDRLQEMLFSELDELVLNGHPEERLPNTLNLSVPDVEGAKILEGLSGLMASTGAACHDRSVKLSHVLSAMGVPPQIGMGALRLTVGRSNTLDQIEEAAGLIVKRVKALKGQF